MTELENNKLEVTIGNVKYRNPLFLGSTPATGTLDQWDQAWEHGAGAIVTKTAMDTSEDKGKDQQRRAIWTDDRMSIFNAGSTSNEMCDINTLVDRLEKFYQKKKHYDVIQKGNFPIIPSITTKETKSKRKMIFVDFLAIDRIVKPIYEFAKKHELKINIEINMRYFIRSIEQSFLEDDQLLSLLLSKNDVDEYFSISSRSTESIIGSIIALMMPLVRANRSDGIVGFIAKLPYRSDLLPIAVQCQLAKFSAITVINTIKSPLPFSKYKRDEWPFINKAKLFQVSGEALKELSRTTLYRLAKAVKIPIISSGGVAMDLQKRLTSFREFADRLRAMIGDHEFISRVCEESFHDYFEYLKENYGMDVDISDKKRILEGLERFSKKIARFEKKFEESDDIKGITWIKDLRVNYWNAAIDIIERIELGAAAVQLSSAVLSYPGYRAIKELLKNINEFYTLRAMKSIEPISEIVGEIEKSKLEEQKLLKGLPKFLWEDAKAAIHRMCRYSHHIESSNDFQKIRAEMNSDKCKRCQFCLWMHYCDAIAKDSHSGKLYIKNERCNGCGTCYQMCPNHDVIKMIPV